MEKNQIRELMKRDDERIGKRDMLADLKVLMADYYVAEIKGEKNSVVVKFLNGQSFRIKVSEVSA